MAIGNRALRGAQISNVENTPWTPEAATEVLLFEKLKFVTQDKEFYKPKQDRASLAANIETPFQVSQYAEGEGEGTLYDRAMVFMAANGIRGNVSATQPDSLNQPLAYLHTYEPTHGTPNTPDETNGIDTFTLEWFDNIQSYEGSIFTTKIEISGKPNEDVKFNWSMGAKNVTESTKTAALTAPSAKYFAFNQAKWFVDANYAGIGGTQKSGVLKAFKWTLETKFTPRFTASGNLYLDGLNEETKCIEVELTLLRDNTITEAELDKYLAQTTSYQRIALLSQGEIDSGQANPAYIYLDYALKYTEWPELDDDKGASIITVKGQSWLDSTASKQFGVKILTPMAAFA